MKKCSNCDAVLEGVSGFCPYCGIAIEDEIPKTEEQASTDIAEQPVQVETAAENDSSVSAEATDADKPVAEQKAFVETAKAHVQPAVNYAPPPPPPFIAGQPAPVVPPQPQYAPQPNNNPWASPVYNQAVPPVQPVPPTVQPGYVPPQAQTPYQPPVQYPQNNGYTGMPTQQPQAGYTPNPYTPKIPNFAKVNRPSTGGMMAWSIVMLVLGALGMCIFGIFGTAVLVMGIIATVQVNGANKTFYDDEFFSKLHSAKVLNIISSIILGVVLIFIFFYIVLFGVASTADSWYYY